MGAELPRGLQGPWLGPEVQVPCYSKSLPYLSRLTLPPPSLVSSVLQAKLNGQQGTQPSLSPQGS